MRPSDLRAAGWRRGIRWISRRAAALLLCLLTASAAALSLTGCKKELDKEAEPDAATEAPKVAAADTAPAIDPLSFDTPEIPDDGSEGFYSEEDPGVYIYRKMAFEMCGASDEAAEDYAAAISEFKREAPDFTVYNMVVPTHVEFGLPARITDEIYTASQSQNIKNIYTGYTEDVKPVNCYNKLCGHIDEYLYFNTDHHWTGLGAYYAYQAFCEQTGQTALQLSDCTENKIEDFEGSFADCDQSLYENLDTVYYWTFPYATHAMRQDEPGEELYEIPIYYESIGSGRSSYSTFICGDAPLFIEYNDDEQNGKKIAVIKESYGNAFVPYLTYNYEEVHVIDFRYFGDNLKEYMQENGITEVLFLNNIMSANAAVQVDRILEII